MTMLDATLAALSDPTRRTIIGRLAHGSATVSQLVELFDLTQPTISSHLKVLEKSGLIERARVGQTRPCRLRREALSELEGWLGQLRTVYEANYARLDQVLDDLKADPEGDTES